MNTPELFPERTVQTITVAAVDIQRTEQRLRDVGAVLLGFSVTASTCTLKVIMPPGEIIEAIDALNQVVGRKPTYAD